MGFRLVLLVVLALFSLPVATATGISGSNISWARTFSGTEGFAASSVEQTADGGFIVAGTTVSAVLQSQTWLVRLDPTGAVMWQKSYGTFTSSVPILLGGPKAKQTPDGGFVVASATNVSLHTTAAWVFKVDGSGNLIWQQAYTGIGNATAFSIDLTTDGGFLVVGPTFAHPGSTNAFVLKLNSNGGVEWGKAYPGQGNTVAFSVRHTSDGGSIVAGGTGTIIPNAWLLRLDSTGGVVWQEAYVGTVLDLFSVQQTSDGGFVAAGVETVLRVDSAGAPLWQKSYGGVISAALFSIQQTFDGGYVLAGSSGTAGAPHSPNALLIRLDSVGNIVWQRNFVEGSISEALFIDQTSDGGFVVAGFAFPTTSFSEAVVLRLNSKGLVQHCTPLSAASLVASNTSLTETNLAIAGVDVSTIPITTSSISIETFAITVALCHHGFRA